MMSSQLIFKYFETPLFVLKIVSVISYNNDDNRWRIAKRLKFGVKIIREVGYIYISNVLRTSRYNCINAHQRNLHHNFFLGQYIDVLNIF